MKELVARVRVAARRGVRAQEVERGEPIEIEELRVDPRNVQAYVDGEERGADADRVPAPLRARARAGTRADARRAAAEDLGPPADAPRPHRRRLRPQAAREDRPARAEAHIHPHSVRSRATSSKHNQRGQPPSRSRRGRAVVAAAQRAAQARASAEAQRFLNRELSWLDFDARVLELAADPTLPLLERVKFCSIFSSNLDEFFEVRVGGLMGQALSGIAVELARRRTPQQTPGRDPRARARARRRAVDGSGSASSARRSTEQGIVIGRDLGLLREGARGAGRALRARDLPGPDAARGRPGPAVPVHLGALALARRLRADPESGEERFARVKVPELLPRFIGRQAQLYLPARARDRALAHSLFPKMEIAECARVPGHARRRLRGLRRGRRPARGGRARAAPAALRRHGAARGLRVDVATRCSSACRRGLGAARRPGLPRRGAPRPRRAQPDRRRSTGPSSRTSRGGRVTQPRLAAATTDGELFEEIRRADILVHLPVRVVRDDVEAFVQAAARDPDVIAIKTTVYRTSDESPLVPRADRRRRGRQAERVPRRAEGALRRAAEHRVVAGARACGRARRLRLPEPEDPRQGRRSSSAARAAACAATSTSAPATTTP